MASCKAFGGEKRRVSKRVFEARRVGNAKKVQADLLRVIQRRTIPFCVLIRRCQVLPITSSSPGGVRVAFQKMLLLAAKSSVAASPLLAVHAAHCLATEVGIDWLEL